MPLPPASSAQNLLGWRDEQLRDGAVLWTSLSGERCDHSRSALLFSSLCRPTGIATVGAPEDVNRCGGRTAMMPRRVRARDRTEPSASRPNVG